MERDWQERLQRAYAARLEEMKREQLEREERIARDVRWLHSILEWSFAFLILVFVVAFILMGIRIFTP